MSDISCVDSADCPQGYRCNPERGVCLDTGALSEVMDINGDGKLSREELIAASLVVLGRLAEATRLAGSRS